MTLEETIDLLAVAAAFDRRTVGEGDALAWQAAIGDLDFADSHAAVVAHYRDSTDWIMPGHVRQRVKAMRADRIGRGIPAAPPPELTDEPGRYRQAIRAEVTRIANGMDVRRALGGPLPGEPPVEWTEARKAMRAARAVQETASEETGPAADRQARPA